MTTETDEEFLKRYWEYLNWDTDDADFDRLFALARRGAENPTMLDLLGQVGQLSDELERVKREAERAQDAHGVRFLNYLEETARLSDEITRLRAALREAADELDAYYRAEYSGSHPYSQHKLAEAMASNPARAALGGEHE